MKKKTQQQFEMRAREEAIAAYLKTIAEIPEPGFAPDTLTIQAIRGANGWTLDVTISYKGDGSGVDAEGATLQEALEDAADLFLAEPPEETRNRKVSTPEEDDEIVEGLLRDGQLKGQKPKKQGR